MKDPRILLIDIETLPDLNKALKYWVKLSSFPGKTLRASVSSICSIAYKFLGEKKVHAMCAWDYPSWKKNVNDDRELVRDFAKIVEEADCIVGHNSKSFDWKHIQTRLLLAGHGLMDDKLAHVDTRQIAKKFYFIDNKLQTLGEELYGERKLDHEGWDLWVKTHGREKAAMKTMRDYNIQDVLLLEKIFRKLRPLANVPNYNLMNPYKEKVCPKCGSSRLHSNGRRYTRTRTYRRYVCLDCRAWSQVDIKDELPR